MTSEGYALGEGTGPLRGVRVVEIAGIGPGPHAATVLADLGADVVQVERPGGATSAGPRKTDLLTRGRPSVAIDLKAPAAIEALLELVEGRRAHRGDAAGSGRTARSRPRRLPGEEPAARLRPDDRLGPRRGAWPASRRKLGELSTVARPLPAIGGILGGNFVLTVTTEAEDACT